MTITDSYGGVWDYFKNGWYAKRRPEGGHYADDYKDFYTLEEIVTRWGRA